MHLLNQLGVVCALLVKPEHCRGAGRTGALDRQLDPILNRRILGLAHAEDVTSLDRLLKQGLPLGVDDADAACGGEFKGLVVRAVFLGLLRHQTDVGDAAHGFRVEGTVLFAIVDGDLINPGVAAIRDQCLGVVQLAIGSPHLARLTDHRRHRGIDDHIARNVQIGDALVRIDHRQIRLLSINRLDVGLDFSLLRGRERIDLAQEIGKTQARIDAQRLEGVSVLVKNRLEIHRNGVTEDDRIGDLHHRRLEVQREQHALLFGILYLGGVKRAQGAATHHAGVDDFTRLQLERFLEHQGLAVVTDELDACGGRLGQGEGLFAAVEVTGAHVGNMSL